jgi:hypothetical protein
LSAARPHPNGFTHREFAGRPPQLSGLRADIRAIANGPAPEECDPSGPRGGS